MRLWWLEENVDEDKFDPGVAGRSLRALLDNMPDFIFFKDTDLRFTQVNHAFARYVGLADPGEVTGKTDADFFPAAEAREFLADERHLLTTGEPLIGKSEAHLGADGQTRWVLTTKVPIRDPAGRITGLVGIAREITERKEAEDALQQSKARFDSLIRNALDIITIIDAAGTMLYKSPAVERVFGYQPDELVGRNAFDLIHPDDLAGVYPTFLKMLEDPALTPTVEFRFRHRDESWRWLEATGTNLLADPAVGGLVVNSRDITERKEIEAELRHQAHHDPLTGLPNRTLFMDRLKQAVSETGSAPSAVFFLDLDGFKVVNDSLGHEYGDRLLRAAAKRLASCLRAGDLLARFGGDEFTILQEQVTDVSDAITVAERLLAALADPFTLDGHKLVVTASVGVVLSSSELTAPTELLRAADVALYRAKAKGKGGSAVFAMTRDASALARLGDEASLRDAVARGVLLLHYQPKVELSTGRLVGVEALVRWQHPLAGLLPPTAFIPLAEETGLIVPLGAWVLGEACRQLMAWHEQFPDVDMLEMCVNVSPAQVRHPDLVGQVELILRETGLPPERLALEITEKGLVEDTDAADRAVGGLKTLGVNLAIDDFGAYHAGLGYLRRWPMDLLKLDRTLVADLERNERSRAIVAAVMGLAQTLDMKVVAEGVETKEQLARVRELGCTVGQGYYFARPLPPEELVVFLKNGKVRFG